MWQRLGKFVINNRLVLLIALLLATVVMGYYASKVKLSYEFSRAIPTDNPKFQEYLSFKNTFGEDGNLLVIGIQSDKLFDLQHFTAYQQMQQEIKKVNAVEDIIGHTRRRWVTKRYCYRKVSCWKDLSGNDPVRKLNWIAPQRLCFS